MAILWGTGLETGSTGVFDVASDAGSLELSTVHTGNYAIANSHENANTFSLESAVTELYFAIWIYTPDWIDIIFQNSAGTDLITFTKRGGFWTLRRGGAGGTVLGTSTVTNTTGWHCYELHLLIDNSSGVAQSKFDGNLDIDFSGDTDVATGSEIKRVRITDAGLSAIGKIDDITVGDAAGGWLGDIRYDGLVPNGNDTTEWTPSTGSNYECVDERPPSDTDYVYTSSDEQKDKYTLSDWDGSGKTPLFLVHWLRARKDTAAANQIEHIIDDGTESIGSPVNLTTTFAYYYEITETPPSGGSWGEAAIDGLVIGVRSQIA